MQLTIVEAIRYRVLELCRENGITVNKLAIISGMTQSTLNNIVSGRNKSVTVSTVKKICDGLNITIQDFFDSVYFENLEQEIKRMFTSEVILKYKKNLPKFFLTCFTRCANIITPLITGSQVSTRSAPK